MKTWLALLTCLFVFGCSSTQQEPPKSHAPRASEKAVKEYREALHLYKAKKPIESLKKLGHFIKTFSHNDLTDDAYYLIGLIYFNQNNYFKASQFWGAIVNGASYSEYHDRAAVYAAQCQYQLGHPDEALNLLGKFQYTPDGSDASLATRAFELSSKIKLAKKLNVAALKDLMMAMKIKKTLTDYQTLQFKANDIVKSYFTQDQLNDIIGNPDFDLVEPTARFKLGVLLYDQKSWPAAKIQFEILRDKFTGTDQANKSMEYISFIDSQDRVDANTLGVVLPLTGKYSNQGYKVLRGIQLATHVFDRSGIKLAIVDSEGNPDIARKAVDRLVSEDHIIAIIGDVAGKTAQAVAERSQELGVPCLTLSQKQGLPELGEFIFRNNLTPDMQMRSLVNFAMKTKGQKKFAILYPNDPYGTEYATAFWDYVLVNGGEIVAAQTYSPDETDFREPIQRMIGTYFIEEDRGKEFQIRLNEWKKEQKPRTAREKPPKELMPPVVDFDALFVPDGPKSLGQISSMLTYNDVDKVTLVGTNLWNSTQTVTRAGKFAENALFIDESPYDKTNSTAKKFTAEFQNMFGYAPDIFEIQGYDAAVLVARAMQNASSRPSLRSQLASLSNVTGAVGPLTMSPSREVEKSLTPLTIKSGQIVKADN